MIGLIFDMRYERSDMRKELRIERLMIVVSDQVAPRSCRWKWCNHGWRQRHRTLFYIWVGKYWINFRMVTLYDRNMAHLQHGIVRQRLGILD